MERLKFLETVTVNEFKTQKGVNKIEIKQNPHTGKCFFVYGCETGAVHQWRSNQSCYLPSMLT